MRSIPNHADELQIHGKSQSFGGMDLTYVYYVQLVNVIHYLEVQVEYEKCLLWANFLIQSSSSLIPYYVILL